MVQRVTVTATAQALIDKLAAHHGPLLFHQSGGCCDGSAPMCYPRGDFRIGQRDVYLGEIAGCPFYISGPQFEYWQHTHLIIDAVPGRGSGFSIEAPEGMRFLTRSRVFTDAENDELERMGAPPRGPEAMHPAFTENSP
ncbi:MAG TPA: DUF779 domain-containing protein [Hyphomicrobium sp.]|jgi:hypothetical protein